MGVGAQGDLTLRRQNQWGDTIAVRGKGGAFFTAVGGGPAGRGWSRFRRGPSLAVSRGVADTYQEEEAGTKIV